MTLIRTTINRLFASARTAEEHVHFHRRSEVVEPCHDRRCTIPRLEA